MLYHHWRDESVDLVEDGSSASMYERLVKRLLPKVLEYEKNRDKLEQATEDLMDEDDVCPDVCANIQQSEHDDMQTVVEQTNDLGFFDPDRPANQRNYDIAVDVGLRPNADMEVGEVVRGRISDDDYISMVRHLNKKQREFFLHAIKWIRTKTEPLRVFLSGGAGCGKSVVVNSLYQCLHRCLCSTQGDNPEDCRILLCAPTGKAAYQIKGVTLHSAFKFNPNRSLMKQDVLSSSARTTLVNLYRHLKVVIVDEVSMVGNKCFRLLDKRLQQIKENNQFMGGVHLIMVGDFFQLRPVMDGWIFELIGNHYCSLACNLWKDNNFVLHELTEIMRQKDDLQYAQIMNRLREGNQTDEDISVLKSCKVAINVKVHPDYPLDKGHLFVSNKKVNGHNSFLFEKRTNPNAGNPVDCADVVLGHYLPSVKEKTLQAAKKKSVSETANLMTKLPIAVNQRYDICTNLNIPDGLINGTGCVLKHVSYEEQQPGRPSILWVKIDDDDEAGKDQRKKYERFYKHGIDKTWTPLFAAKRQFNLGRDFKPVERKQFPLRPAAAKTIHKSQGSTVREVVVDLSFYRKTAGSHYVALSRIPNKSGLFLLDLAEDNITVDQNVVVEMERLRTNETMDLCYIPVYNFPSDSLKVSFLNARSLHKHFDDVKHDHSMQCSDIMAFCETRLYEHEQDIYRFEGYNLHMNCQPQNSQNVRPHLGLAVYVKEGIDVLDVTCLRFSDNEYLILKFIYRSVVVQAVVLYRKSASNMQQFFRDISKISEYLDPSNKLLVIGDFNCDMNTSFDAKVTIESHCHVKHIKTEPTFQNTSGAISAIDNAFGNVENYLSSEIECPYTDHKIVA